MVKSLTKEERGEGQKCRRQESCDLVNRYLEANVLVSWH